jgi:type I restriction enzyme S subunit
METIFLTEICTPKQWKTISSSNLLESGYPVYGANGIIGHYSGYTHEEQTVLITCRGATCGTINVSEPKSYVNGNAMALDNLSKDYDLNFLKYILIARGLNDVISGSAQPQITRTGLKNVRVPNPPLKTQQRIAGILDNATALRDKTAQLLIEYDLLAQSVFLEMFGDVVSNPKGLEIRKLGDLGKWQSGGTPSRSITAYYDGKIPWLSSGELNEMYISDSKEHITEKALKESSTKLVPKGSLLLGMYDTAALKSTINTIDLACNQAIAFGVLDPELINIVYAYYIIQIGKDHYKRLQRGARQQNLNLSLVKAIKILYSPLELQNEFADKIALIEQQKALAKQELQQSEDLFNCLLQQAFMGEL